MQEIKACWIELLYVSEKERNNTTREDTRGSGGNASRNNVTKVREVKKK